ncbi:MAG: hypothetical protein IT210_22630 [Armatimonadetes bacterium]|nr:hypothetical protein [Armatimonadota bacterium]
MSRILRLSPWLVNRLVVGGIALVCLALIALWARESWELARVIRMKNLQVDESLRVLQGKNGGREAKPMPLKSALSDKATDPLPAFTVQLASLAKASQVEIVLIKSQPKARAGAEESYPFDLEATGSLSGLRSYLSRLTALPLVEAERWAIKNTSPGAVLTGRFAARRAVGGR